MLEFLIVAALLLASIALFKTKSVPLITINPQFQDLKDESGDTLIDCYCPADGSPLGIRLAASASDVLSIVTKAKLAQATRLSFATRAAILKTLLDYIVNNQDFIIKKVVLDTGKSEIDAAFGEILVTCEKIRWTIENGESVLKEQYRSTGMIMIHKSARVEYIPVGVMGAIVSWNYPYLFVY